MKFQRRFMIVCLVFLLSFLPGCRNMDTITQNRAETQQTHPDPSLRPRMYRTSTTTVFEATIDLINKLPRWKWVQQEPSSGLILAERRSRLFQFVDDVRIEITRTPSGETAVHAVSQSRIGKWDFGQNARNIRTLLNALDEKTQSTLSRNPVQEGLFTGLSGHLKKHVEHLALGIGERHFAKPEALDLTADYIHSVFTTLRYKPEYETFQIDHPPLLTELRTGSEERHALKGALYKNVVATLQGRLGGRNEEIIVIGAHYDTVAGSPGADDNASGVAVLLEVARLLQGFRLDKTVVFVAFTNEESPFFRTSAMGSAQYVASALRQNKKIIFMVSLEMLGFYTDHPASQTYPPFLRFFYPDRGNFITIAGNLSSRTFVKKMAFLFRNNTDIPLEALALPRFVPGIDFSDQLNFWKKGIPAVMMTDTAFYRNPHYHLSTDLPQTLDYEKMAEVAKGMFFYLLDQGKVIST
ncbi:MAG: M28 family peptidase [Nitrospira sp.]